MRRTSSGWLLAAGLWAAAGASSGCSAQEAVVLQQRATLGSVQLALSVADLEIDTLTAVLSRPGDDGFEPRTQTIDVRGQEVISVFFSDLPVGRGYTLELRAGACSGSSSFSIQAATTIVVEVSLSCEAQASGGAQVTASVGPAAPVANVPAPIAGKPCAEGSARDECRQAEPMPPATPDAEPATADAGPATADAGPPASDALDCSRCTRDFCGAKQGAASALAAAGPILGCVVGPDWQAAARAKSSSCANADLIGCYCGSVAPALCSNTAPSALDGQCRELLLGGSGCSDSSCVQANLLQPGTATGSALRYVRCQQDFCYDVCFNP
ncbi:MAG TPA: hypothetical protein VFS67_19115 [Polyangiaceae bacterium]|nr:hypothetical protein [Polyangiaceae bacterium]